MSKTWKPVSRRVIISPISENEEVEDNGTRALLTPGGIVMPESAGKPPITGVVIAVGPECEWLNRGDLVMFAEHHGATITLGKDKRKTLVLDERDVLAYCDVGDGEDLPELPKRATLAGTPKSEAAA